MTANVRHCEAVHFSFIQQVQTVSLFVVSYKQHYMNLRCKHMYILSFENSGVLSHCSQDGLTTRCSSMFYQLFLRICQ